MKKKSQKWVKKLRASLEELQATKFQVHEKHTWINS